MGYDFEGVGVWQLERDIGLKVGIYLAISFEGSLVELYLQLNHRAAIYLRALLRTFTRRMHITI